MDAVETGPHLARCWFPVGTDVGRAALEHNIAAHLPQTEAAVAGDDDLVARLELVDDAQPSGTAN